LIALIAAKYLAAGELVLRRPPGESTRGDEKKKIDGGREVVSGLDSKIYDRSSPLLGMLAALGSATAVFYDKTGLRPASVLVLVLTFWSCFHHRMLGPQPLTSTVPASVDSPRNSGADSGLRFWGFVPPSQTAPASLRRDYRSSVASGLSDCQAAFT